MQLDTWITLKQKHRTKKNRDIDNNKEDENQRTGKRAWRAYIKFGTEMDKSTSPCAICATGILTTKVKAMNIIN